MRFFCLNLQSQVERRRFCEQQFAIAGLDVQFVEAFPAKKSAIRHVAETMTKGMVGCFISHERLLEETVRNGYGVTVILEDDIILAKDFNARLLQKIAELPAEWDIAFLGYGQQGSCNWKTVNASWKKLNSGHVHGFYGYVVSDKGARNVLAQLHPMRSQIDLQIFDEVKRNRLNGYFITTPIVEHPYRFITTVQRPSVTAPVTANVIGGNKMLCQNALVISLKRSAESRLKPFMKRWGFEGTLDVIDAVDGMSSQFDELKNTPLERRTYATLLSHIRAIEFAKGKNWDCVLILEDDIDFIPEFNSRLRNAMVALPENWDMLWLAGADQIPPTGYNDQLNRLISSWGAYGYVLRNTVYDFFLNAMRRGQLPSDDYYRRNHSRFNSFKTKSPLVFHLVGISDRTGALVA